jgi:hypothetical protein
MKDRIRFNTKVFLVFLVSLWLGSSSSLLAAPFSFAARHDHLKGACSGKLTIGENEISFEGPKHHFRWPYQEIQQLRLLDSGRIDLLSYEDGSKWKLGADRAFYFRVAGGPQNAAGFLAAKLDRRLVVGLPEKPAGILAEFPVKHLRPLGGDNGTLVFGEETVTFTSQDKAESRAWRYQDVESIATSGRDQLSITTYERQRFHYATRRVFNFQLKQPISEDTFNVLWRKVNKP